MDSIVNLKNHKDKKKAAVIAEDLAQVTRIMSLTLDALKHYNKYIQVAETISCVQNSKTLIDIHLKKYERILGKNEDTVEKT